MQDPVEVQRGYLASLPRGRRPRVGYVVGETLLPSQGTKVDLPDLPGRATYVSALSYGRGLLVARNALGPETRGGANVVVLRLTARGVERARWYGDEVTMDDDSGAVLWREAPSRIHVGRLRTGRDRVVDIADIEAVPLALLGRGLLAQTSRPVGPVLLDADGRRLKTPPALQALARVRAVSELSDLVIGERRGGPFAERSAALRLGTADLLWTSDRWSVRTLSPLGDVASAISSATGGDPDAIGILDTATGGLLAEMPLLGRRLGEVQSVFEPDGSLLVEVVRSTPIGYTWAVLRLRPDGGVERATRVLSTGRRYAPPFALGDVVMSLRDLSG